MQQRLLMDDLWGGWQSAKWDVYPADFYSYVNCTWVPKLTPLIHINNRGQLEVGGFNLNIHLRRREGGPGGKFYSDLYQHANRLQQKAMDLKEQMIPTKGPVPRTKKEDWVEKAMWEMGMSRSNYRPEPLTPPTNVNVGTVGHIDHGKISLRQYLGRTVYVAPRK